MRQRRGGRPGGRRSIRIAGSRRRPHPTPTRHAAWVAPTVIGIMATFVLLDRFIGG